MKLYAYKHPNDLRQRYYHWPLEVEPLEVDPPEVDMEPLFEFTIDDITRLDNLYPYINRDNSRCVECNMRQLKKIINDIGECFDHICDDDYIFIIAKTNRLSMTYDTTPLNVIDDLDECECIRELEENSIRTRTHFFQSMQSFKDLHMIPFE